MTFNKYLTTFFLLLPLLQSHCGELQCYKINEVKITNGPFYQAQQTDLNYILALDVDRLLAPFLIDAGFTPKAERYPNWENTGLDGHIGGHYLSALSLMYASTNNEIILERLNYMIRWLDSCQLKNGNGYVGGIPGGQAMWDEIASGKIYAGSFSLNDKWVPLYNIHKLYAGLRDAYLVAGNVKARDILIKLSDWAINLTKNLTNEQIQTMLLSEHGGLNEVFADVAYITGDEKYLALAHRFSHQEILNPLLLKQNKLTGLHANTQIPKVIGYKRIADIENDTLWAEAASFFWSLIHDKWTISIGGNSVEEHLHPYNNFSTMITSVQGPETCNTYNMLRLTKSLLLTDPQAKYFDFYERALYNHILSSENPDKGGFVYFTPMRPAHYRVYSQPQQSFWCCVGSGMENHGKYGELIYLHNDTDVFVNLFIPSKLSWTDKEVEIEQITAFPYSEMVKLKLKMNEPKVFGLKIRYPGWVKKGNYQVFINGKEEIITDTMGIWCSIYQQWNTGDSIEIKLPMETSVEYLPDGSSYASIVHGPIVLAAKTGITDLTGLFADDSRMGHVADGPLYTINESPTIISQKENFSENITPLNNETMTFQYTGTVSPEKFNSFELVPFFSLHECRYTIYFKVTEPEQIELPGYINEKNSYFSCYPNPIINKINIDFSLKQSQKANIAIYNIQGTEIESIVNEIYQPGSYKIIWNLDKYNQGIYFCKLQLENEVIVKKIILQ